MPASSPAPSSEFIEFSRLLRNLHALIRNGEGEGAEADELRDAMDGHWNALSPREAKLARALSADLNTIGEDSHGPVSLPAYDDERLRELRRAEAERDWERILALLRGEASGIISPYSAAYIKGRCWTELADGETGLTFFEEAVRLVPQDYRSWIFIISTLIRMGRADEANRLALEVTENAGPLIPGGWIVDPETGSVRESVQRRRGVG
jgi:tetratricopeptide (TPR) repeat protein